MARLLDRGLGGRDHIGAADELRRGDALLGLRHRGLVAVVRGDGIVELRLGDPAFVVKLLDTLEIGDRLLEQRLGLVERGFQHLDLARPLQFGLGVGEPRIGLIEPCPRGGDARLLRLALQREDRRALGDVIALLDRERLDAAALLGADQHEVGLHIAGKLAQLTVRAAGERGSRGHQECGANYAGHERHYVSPVSGARIASTRRSILVASSASVSRWR